MKILILSCSTGGGHNAAAKADRGVSCGARARCDADGRLRASQRTHGAHGRQDVCQRRHKARRACSAARIRSPCASAPTSAARPCILQTDACAVCLTRTFEKTGPRPSSCRIFSRRRRSPTCAAAACSTSRASSSARITPASRFGRRRTATRISCRMSWPLLPEYAARRDGDLGALSLRHPRGRALCREKRQSGGAARAWALRSSRASCHRRQHGLRRRAAACDRAGAGWKTRRPWPSAAATNPCAECWRASFPAIRGCILSASPTASAIIWTRAMSYTPSPAASRRPKRS